MDAIKTARILFAATLVLISLSVANYFAWLRLKPEVAAIGWIVDKPDYESHLVNMHQRALARVSPGAPDAYLPIYDVRNPGFFLLVAELFVRAGATTPLPLEILSIVLFDVGALCFFFWVYLLFSDLLVAAFALSFLALSQFFLFFPGVTHTMPFEFFFFNATLLLFVLYLKRNVRAYLVGALVAMFLTCMNYWFYYMSSWIIMVGLWWQYRGRPRLRDIAMISTPPLAAASLTMIMVMSLTGGMRSGGLRLLEILAARTVDARVPGGAWLPDQKFMFAADWSNYPFLVKYRLEWAYNIDLKLFAWAAACVLIMLWFHKRSSAISALILLAGGFSWYYVMFQHTHIHHFTGQYSFMAICSIAGLIAGETINSIGRALALARHWTRTRDQATRTALNIALAIVLGVVSSRAIIPYLKNTGSLIKETVVIASTVEAKYRDAVGEICKHHPEITQTDLERASSTWGIDWRAKQLADTNQLPKCPT
ncbi:hypothetical protein [Bradyrhizobium guangxiense]|uniref:hypothetical protein n=1 Tax=Bradyrhizobium guangxiense TaxID=1325115 RepID=UPI001008A314|nr:hypothetical protein [Bradyrhizobium guangxiense]